MNENHALEAVAFDCEHIIRRVVASVRKKLMKALFNFTFGSISIICYASRGIHTADAEAGLKQSDKIHRIDIDVKPVDAVMKILDHPERVLSCPLAERNSYGHNKYNYENKTDTKTTGRRRVWDS